MATLILILTISLFFASALTKSLDLSFSQGSLFVFIINSINYHSNVLQLTITVDDGEYGEYFEGDLMLNAEQFEAIKSHDRNGLINLKYRWPNKTVVYKMNANHTKEQQLYIKMAQWAIESVSCIKFVSHTNESEYIALQVSP